MSIASGHIYLRRGKRGEVWYAKFRLPDGRQVKKQLGRKWTGRSRPPAGHLTRRLAEARLRELMSEAQRGVLPPPGIAGATFGEACEEWLRYVEHDRGRASSPISDYRSVVSHDLLPEFGENTPLLSITVDRIDAYRVRLVGEGRLSNRTINKHLVLLNGIFRRAQRVWSLAINPVAAVDRQPLRRTGDFEVLTPAEVEALARAAEFEQDAALFTTAAFTGLRMGELRALRWGDLDFSKRLVHVRRGFTRWQLGDTKSHKVRSVPMIDQVLRTLDGLSQREYFTGEGDLVFPNEVGNFLDDSRLRRRFRKALPSVGSASATKRELSPAPRITIGFEMAEWMDPDDLSHDGPGYGSAEEAARGDIPPEYSPTLFVDYDPSGEYAVVLLGTNDGPELYPYEEFCRRKNDRWHSLEGSNGNTQFAIPGQISLFTSWGEAPEGATVARVTFQGKTYDCPVRRGFYRLTVWDWDEDAYEVRGEELDWLMLKQAHSEQTKDGTWTIHMDRGRLNPEETTVWDEYGTQRHPDVEFLHE